MRKLVSDRGRCTLAEIGDHLRETGVRLPANTKLSDLVLQHADEFRLSGPPNNRKVSRLADTTERAMLDTVQALLRQHGPMTSAELRRRLRERRKSIPGLVSLLQRHTGEFVVQRGAVWLVEQLPRADEEPLPDAVTTSAAAAATGREPVNEAATASAALPAPLVRLHSLNLPAAMDESGLESLQHLREVVLIDLDNRAFALEAATCYATCEPGTLVLTFCARGHNPRLSQLTASRAQALADGGRLRLLRPLRDGANAADFVLAFWAGWLHARVPEDTRFVIVSADSAIEQTVGDTLVTLRRVVDCEPTWLNL